MAERTSFHVWLHGLPTEHVQALRDARKGPITPKQKAILATMPPAFVMAATTERTKDGNQG